MSFGSTSNFSDHSTALRVVSVRLTDTRKRSSERRMLPSRTYLTFRSRPTSTGVGLLPLVAEYRSASDHRQLAETPERRDKVFGHPVGEIIAVAVRTQRGEG